MPMIDLTIIIVSWNCREYLSLCLQSLHGHPPTCTYKIVVIDNASTDGVVEYIREQYPSVSIIQNTVNEGFAAANNLALKQFKSSYYLLLNPDTEVYPGSLQALVEYADQNKQVWALGPAIVNGDGTPQRTGVRFPSNWNIFVETFFLDRLFPQTKLFGSHRELYKDYSLPRQVDYVQGSCLLISQKALEEVGLLDESFFMFFEETDWCYRVHKAGREIHLVPGSMIKHYGGGETAHYDERKVQMYHRSLLRYYKKHFSLLRSYELRCILVARSIIRIVVWTLVPIVHRSMKEKAFSTCRGYLKLLPLLVRKSLL
jgi:GT2 family glycosyltransferase